MFLFLRKRVSLRSRKEYSTHCTHLPRFLGDICSLSAHALSRREIVPPTEGGSVPLFPGFSLVEPHFDAALSIIPPLEDRVHQLSQKWGVHRLREDRR